MFSNREGEELQKIYILENKKWRDEIIKYINQNSNRKYYLNLIKDKKFIIRMYERNDYKSEQYRMHYYLSKCPNIAEIYLMIKKRDLPLINNERKELIDIEKKYDKSIKDIVFDKIQLKNFLYQLIYSQIDLFDAWGIVHNNIHEGNIFVENNDDELVRKYTDDTFYYIYNDGEIYYKNINKKIKSNIRYILSDFTKGRIYKPGYGCGMPSENGYDISILKNLEDTIILGQRLFNCSWLENINVPEKSKNKYDELLKKLHKNGTENEYKNYDVFYNDFKNDVIKLCWDYVDNILAKFD
jgi:hypothetical protein